MATSSLPDRGDDLGSRLHALALKLGSPPPANHVLPHWAAAFETAYSQKQRHYHTQAHIGAMLTCLDAHRHLLVQPNLVELAIFFHDWVYEPTARDNEMRSIDLLSRFAADVHLSEKDRERVASLIERTITHTLPDVEAECRDGDLRLFLDFDLEVLSRPEREYDEYARQIRREYEMYSDAEFCTGRVKVLRGFLGRERLYFSDAFYEAREAKARMNVAREIEMLESKAASLEAPER
jgi:predicted metal-dependent HD superfamily phosphohydrolase